MAPLPLNQTHLSILERWKCKKINPLVLKLEYFTNGPMPWRWWQGFIRSQVVRNHAIENVWRNAHVYGHQLRSYFINYHSLKWPPTVYPKKYAHGFVVLCFVVVMQSFIMNSYEVFIHIHQGCFAGTGAIVRLPQFQWSKPDGYGQYQSIYNHNKARQSKNRVHISWDILYIYM